MGWATAWELMPGLGLEKKVCSLFLLTWLSLPRVPASSLSTLSLTLENLCPGKAQEG